jgi:hypothetical protein
LWWREADQESGYLEGLYKQREIGFRASESNLPNFNPLIRLIWNMEELGTSERVTVSQWNKALQKVHEHFVENPNDFRHNAEGKLAAYIQREGGIVGLTTGKPASDEDEPTRHPRKKSDGPKISVQSQTEIARRSLTELKALKQGVGSATIRGTVRVGGEGLLGAISPP